MSNYTTFRVDDVHVFLENEAEDTSDAIRLFKDGPEYLLVVRANGEDEAYLNVKDLKKLTALMTKLNTELGGGGG
jgi:hypothetical protein